VTADRPPLPIDPHLACIRAELLQHNCLIIEAPPGTGKTTRASPALLTLATSEANSAKAEPLAFPQGKILLVQPRRIAARAAAARIAAELGVNLGGHVGYQVRFDSRVSSDTRLIALTPGILLRKLQKDAVLEDVAAVVLDEFHERSLEYDMLLGMLRRIQTELRPELRLVLMSATLERESLTTYLEQPPLNRVPLNRVPLNRVPLNRVPLIRVTAETYPVRHVYSRFQSPVVRGRTPASPRQRIIEQTVDAIRRAAREGDGDMLAFLPGVGEIRSVEQQLERDAVQLDWQLLPLFGDMSPQEQDAVLQPSPRRKIILATNVAETSLTIDGVRIVIDSGWARVQRVDSSIGLNMLVLEPISKASADQRAGRAGRTAPGVCFRLWDEITGRSRSEHLEPEVLRVDLTGAVLQLLCWGEADLAAFPWLTSPTPQALEQALKTLRLLQAVDDTGVTDLGRLMNRLPVQPRLARLLLAGHALRIPYAAAVAAACLSERDVFDRQQPAHLRGTAAAQTDSLECDVTFQVQTLIALARHGERRAAELSSGTLKTGAARYVLRVADQLARLLTEELGPCDERDLEQELPQALLLAFPDRMAKRRGHADPRGLMVGGRGVKLEDVSKVRRCELFLCLDADAGGSEARVRQASAIDAAWLPAALRTTRTERFFNSSMGAVVTRRRDFFLDLLLNETPVETPSDEETARMLGKAAAERLERLLPAKDKALHSLLTRMQWLQREAPDARLPSFEIEALSETIAGWCYGMRRLDELKALPWLALFESLLNSAARKQLDAQAPESLQLPTGRVVWLQYELGKPPVLAARIQELFGWSQTPRLANGKIPLLLHLLAPNGRVQQITDDLASFWANTYLVVRKELRGRYPKHAWPEDPRTSQNGR
jgi:ATP-dependent helicase HrpB